MATRALCWVHYQRARRTRRAGPAFNPGRILALDYRWKMASESTRRAVGRKLTAARLAKRATTVKERSKSTGRKARKSQD